MEETVSNKVNTTDLSNYYTKGEIEDIRDDYYTAAEVEDRIAEMDTSASSEYIRNLTVQVRSNLEQIQNISAAVDGMATQHLVSQFDESILGED